MQANYTQLTVLDVVPFGLTAGGARFFALRLSRPDWKEWHSGQFVMLRPESFGLELPWGRPFSICHMTHKHLVCFFKVVGKGTEKLAALKPGEKVDTWGPLGNFFAQETEQPTLLLAAGMGIAPFVAYVNNHPKPWNMSMLFGHREPIGCYPVDSINEHIPIDSLRETRHGDLENFIYTLQEKIRDCASQNGLVLACGPTPFLKTVQKFAKKFKARAQLSLESRMACGLGACLGCVCRAKGSPTTEDGETAYVPVCTHGPVFWADKVEL